MLDDATAAVSGRYGIVSLLEWNNDKQQYRIARRLGAVTNCYGLAINDNGSVWFNAGRWNRTIGRLPPFWTPSSGAASSARPFYSMMEVSWQHCSKTPQS